MSGWNLLFCHQVDTSVLLFRVFTGYARFFHIRLICLHEIHLICFLDLYICLPTTVERNFSSGKFQGWQYMTNMLIFFSFLLSLQDLLQVTNCKTNHRVHRRDLFNTVIVGYKPCYYIILLLVLYTHDLVPKCIPLTICCQELNNFRDWLDWNCLLDTLIVPSTSPQIQHNTISPKLQVTCKNTG